MKRISKTFFLIVAFTTSTFFMSCSNTIQEEEQSQTVEQSEEKTEVLDSARCGFSNHGGRTGNSISDGHCSNRGGRSGRSSRRRH